MRSGLATLPFTNETRQQNDAHAVIDSSDAHALKQTTQKIRMPPTTLRLLHCVSKKQDTKLLPITSQMLTDFQNSFTDRLIGNFATN